MSVVGKYCQNCGAPLTTSGNFCQNCGAQILGTPTAPTPSPPSPPTVPPPTYQPPGASPPPSMTYPSHEAGSLGLGLLVAILLGVTIGIILIIGVFLAGFFAGLIARGAGREVVVGLVAEIANWFLIVSILSLFTVQFPRPERLMFPADALEGLVLTVLFIIYGFTGLIGGLIGGAIRPQHHW